MNNFKKIQNIKCDHSIFIIAFKGWSDAAEGATSALRSIVSQYDAEMFASFEDEEFFAFARERPIVRTIGKDRVIEWPKNDLYLIPSLFDGDTSLIVLDGTEPHFKWKTFSQEISSLLNSLNVEAVVSLGALLDSIPHTRGVQTTVTGVDQYMPKNFTQKKIEPSRYEGPTGITSIILDDFRKLGIPSMSIWAHAPHYLQTSPNPLVSQALLEELNKWLPLSFDVNKLEKKSQKYIKALDNAIAQDNELKTYIEKLESKYDSAIIDFPPPNDETLLKDLEKFLKTQRGNGNTE